jgi:hypothetical protein
VPTTTLPRARWSTGSPRALEKGKKDKHRVWEECPRVSRCVLRRAALNPIKETKKRTKRFEELARTRRLAIHRARRSVPAPRTEYAASGARA